MFGFAHDATFPVSALFVPAGYTSGAALNGGMTFNNTDLATMGLIPGTYTSLFTWGSGADADRIDLVILAAAEVPLPATAMLLFAGVGALCLGRRNRRQAG